MTLSQTTEKFFFIFLFPHYSFAEGTPYLAWLSNAVVTSGLEKPLGEFTSPGTCPHGRASACPLGASFPALCLPPAAAALPWREQLQHLQPQHPRDGLSQTTSSNTEDRGSLLLLAVQVHAFSLPEPSCPGASPLAFELTHSLAFPPSLSSSGSFHFSKPCHTLLFVAFCKWRSIFPADPLACQVSLPLSGWLHRQHMVEAFSGQQSEH